MHDFAAAQKKQHDDAAARVAAAADARQERIRKLTGPSGRPRKIVGTEDFLAVSYLEEGVRAARAVGRVVIREDGDIAGFGTGSLVSSSLLLTNHHVLPSADVAAGSSVEFSFEDSFDGQARTPVVVDLDPERFFLADEDLDFALVAVDAAPDVLAAFGFNTIHEDENDATEGRFVTIVQHPRGEKKQIALRENRIVDVLDTFLHYEADTEPGSSGSPVFDDTWQVIALHHASVRVPEQGELGGFLNEGVRASSLRGFVTGRTFSPDEQALVDAVFA